MDQQQTVTEHLQIRVCEIASMDNVNDLLNYDDYTDKNDAIEQPGDKVFADADSSGLWQVYEKQDPYTQISSITGCQHCRQILDTGSLHVMTEGHVIASAPGKGQGEVHFLFRSSQRQAQHFRHSYRHMTDNDDNTSRLGESLSMSTDENFRCSRSTIHNALAPTEAQDLQTQD